MAKQLLFSEDARRKMLNGVDLTAKAVMSTLGACGRNVVLGRSWGTPVITKDGVTVAKDIELEDPYENMGAQLLKEVASKTNDDAGDGTTTSTVLAYAIIKEGLKAVSTGVSPIAVKRGIDKATAKVVEQLRKNAHIVSGSEAVLNIATVSSNNDSELGAIVTEALDKVGKDGIVTVADSKSTKTSVRIVEGMQFDRGYLSPYFATDPETMSVHFESPYILITDKKISAIAELLPILEKVAQSNKPLLIICDTMEGEALATLVMNAVRGSLRTCVVGAPGLNEVKEATLEDIAILAGGTYISQAKGMSLKEATLEHLGTCGSIKVDKGHTTIVDGNGDKEAIKQRAKEIQAGIDNNDGNRYELESQQRRLARLTSGVAIIEAGAASETELKEIKYRLEDTLAAARAALAEGIVLGGGQAYILAARGLGDIPEDLTDDEKVGYRIVIRALEEPIRQIAENAGLDGSVIASEAKKAGKDMGFNVLTQTWENLFETGIIDPVKVSICAIQNAASVAGLMLTTECAIVDIPKPQNNNNG